MSNISIVKQGITGMAVDAIVNAANSALQAGGGVCGAIFAEAGHDALQKACNEIGHCDTGKAVITPGFDLKAKYIVHAVGPVWHGGDQGEEALLRGCYTESLTRAKENGLGSIAFPLISSGIFGYPKDQAWQVAIKACKDYIAENPDHDIDIKFCVLDDEILALGQSILEAM